MQLEMTGLDHETDGLKRSVRLRHVSKRTAIEIKTTVDDTHRMLYLRRADALVLAKALRAFAHTLRDGDAA